MPLGLGTQLMNALSNIEDTVISSDIFDPSILRYEVDKWNWRSQLIKGVRIG